MRFDVDEARDDGCDPVIAGIALAIVLIAAESPRARAGPYAAAELESLPVMLLLLRLRLAVSDCDGFVVGGDQPRPAMVASCDVEIAYCDAEVAGCKVECGNTLKLRNSSVVLV